MTDWVYDTMLVTCALLAAVMLVRKPVARIFGPTVAYGLWLLPAARVLMPSLEREVATISDAPIDPIGLSDIVPSATLSSDALAIPATDWTQIGVILWLGIAALIFIVQMLRYVTMREAMLAEANELGIVDGVRLVESDQVSGPLAFGLIQRFIAVPLNFNTLFPPAEREMALAHEMAHHRSGDLFANFAAFTLLCLTWFSPLSWIAWRAFRFDQEAACDARVLQGRDGAAKQIYGRALARAAHDGLPTFATALNNRSTIIARLKNLTMNEISKSRRNAGKIGIVAMVGIIVPMTATIVPVSAHDEASANNSESVAPAPKMVTRGTLIDVSEGVKTPFKVIVKRDGRDVVLLSDTKLTDTEIDKMANDAEASRAAADEAMARADNAARQADIASAAADTSAEAADDDWRARETARKEHRKHIESSRSDRKNAVVSARAASAAKTSHSIAIANNRIASSQNGDFLARMIPAIEITEVTENCTEGQPVTTDVRGFDGKNHSSVRLVMCGKGMAKIARTAALAELRQAREDMRADEDVPLSIRRKILGQFDVQIKRLQHEMRHEG
jgi:bla regulator protein blaR1